MSKQRGKTKKAPTKKNSRIKEVSGTHWVLKKHEEVKKYQGFKSKTEAEQFAAATPIEKGVKITATKAKPADAKKKTKTPPVQNAPKPRPTRSGKDKSGKVVSFNAGRAKYGKK